MELIYTDYEAFFMCAAAFTLGVFVGAIAWSIIFKKL